MLRLYMDVHVKAAIITGVRRREIDVVTAQEDGTTRLDDTLLFDRATALARVLFSQDDDLLAIARLCQEQGTFFAGLIYGHQLAATIGKFVLDLEVICKVLDPEDMLNRIEYSLWIEKAGEAPFLRTGRRVRPACFLFMTTTHLQRFALAFNSPQE